MSKKHMRIKVEVFGEEYYSAEKTYGCTDLPTVKLIENALLDLEKKINE